MLNTTTSQPAADLRDRSYLGIQIADLIEETIAELSAADCALLTKVIEAFNDPVARLEMRETLKQALATKQ